LRVGTTYTLLPTSAQCKAINIADIQENYLLNKCNLFPYSTSFQVSEAQVLSVLRRTEFNNSSLEGNSLSLNQKPKELTST